MKKERMEFLDGYRAIAAMFVVFCHLACAFVPEAYFVGMNENYDLVWNNSPLNVITSGRAAVQLFFVLSGFLITMKIYSSQKKNDFFDC